MDLATGYLTPGKLCCREQFVVAPCGFDVCVLLDVLEKSREMVVLENGQLQRTGEVYEVSVLTSLCVSFGIQNITQRKPACTTSFTQLASELPS